MKGLLSLAVIFVIFAVAVAVLMGLIAALVWLRDQIDRTAGTRQERDGSDGNGDDS